MSPQKSPAPVFICARCDAQSPKWTGQCLECGAWGTLQAASPAAATANRAAKVPPPPVTSLTKVRSGDFSRLPTGVGEIDRVFGGGIVKGSVVLLGGEPGIGKSTLAMAICAALAARPDRKIVYVSGEESAEQVKMRAERMKIPTDRFFFLAETEVGAVTAALEKEKPDLAVIDSVQTLRDDSIPSEAGAVNQVRGAAARLTAFAKSSGTPLLLIGHVTKDGGLAGPKTLEHLVDAVLSFEGERSHSLRVLRAMKNRFGSTDETGIFAMTESGLEEIRNPSAYLLEDRRPGTPGSAISCVIEGTRPMLVEVQALVQRTPFGYPTRRASGFDQARLEMLIAVLGRRGGIDLGQHDVYVNIVGGLKVKEPAADLAVVAALASAANDVPLPEDLAVWGEVGLGGEVRSFISADRRLSEARALGMGRVLTSLPRSGKKAANGAIDVKTVRDALAALAAKDRPARGK